MPPIANTSSRKIAGNPQDDDIQCLDRLEELVHAVTGLPRDVKAKQTTLGVSLIHLEQQVLGAGNGQFIGFAHAT
jgi:hypothetical protein